ncbi:MAG: MBL fold metallo-hydrolase [Bacteroidota bacterium]
MKINFLRHATFVLEVNGQRFLVDPMLNKKDAMDTVANAANTFRNPLVDLPIAENEINAMIKTINAVLVTHTHRDHWDSKAIESIDKNIPIICQPADEEKIKGQGFKDVRPVSTKIEFGGIVIHRTEGQHGTGETGKRMGTVSGFVIESKNQKLYIAGDTVWCAEVETALATFKPEAIVLNAGAAQFIEGGPITMTTADIIKVVQAQPKAKVIAVHMEAINHCLLKREELRTQLQKQSLSSHVEIPNDGAVLNL